MQRRSAFGSLSLAFASLVALGACTGVIGEVDVQGGGDEGGAAGQGGGGPATGSGGSDATGGGGGAGQTTGSGGGVCGDGACGAGETCSNCPGDCGACCGNGACDNNETCSSCPGDCGSCCGNGVCGSGETCMNCPADCGACPCGDGVCATNESCMSCPTDCGACPECLGAGPETTELDAEEQSFLTILNNYRAENGRAPLTACKSLNRAAQGHSEDMRDNNYFSHTGLNGSTFSQRASLACYKSFATAENIAAGNSTGSATFDQWKNSPGHNTNMLGSNHKVIGIGRATGGGQYGVYWTTKFGASTEPSCD
jgi:hypothetical protein